MSMASDVTAEVEALARLDLAGLRTIWQEHYGQAPNLRSEDLFRRMLAWRLQAEAFGGFDRDTLRQLNRSGPVQIEGLDLGIGARLSRTWKGKKVEVVVEEDGFRWEGRAAFSGFGHDGEDQALRSLYP
jgi:hypothetical protein